MLTDAEKKIMDNVDRLTEEMITTVQEAIRIPTVNPPGEFYKEFCVFYTDLLKKLDYSTEIIEVPTELVGELAPNGNGLARDIALGKLISPYGGLGPRLHLNGHYDVVKIGDDWKRRPFTGEIFGGKMYGRGTSDMKSGLIMQVYAMESLRRSGNPWHGQVVFSAVPDEESAGNRNAGAGYLIEAGIVTEHNTDAVIISEPFGPEGVVVGHKGTIWGEITVVGKQAHGSAPSLGINAIDLMVEFLHEVSSNLQPILQQRNTTFEITPAVARGASLSFDTINGGEATNIIPARCSVTFNRRLLPEETVKQARSEIVDTLERMKSKNRAFKYTYREFYAVDPVLIPKSAQLVNMATEVIDDFELAPKLLISAASDDQRFFVNNAGITNCIVYGPGDIELAHVSDEYIQIDNLILTTKILAVMLYRLLRHDRLDASSSNE